MGRELRALLYSPKLDLHSGSAQLIHMQVAGLREAGVSTAVACQRGALRFFWATGIWPRRTTAAAIRARAGGSAELVVDHAMQIPEADVVFVHNLATEANRHLDRQEVERAAAERQFFRDLQPRASIVVNSALVGAALVEHFGLSHERIAVHHPGFQSARFDPTRRLELRARARRALGVDDDAPVVGFVTSGNFHKRGLDLFLTTAEAVLARAPSVRFLIVGARKLPEDAAAHPLLTSGSVFYQPKNHHPELWMAALDLFLYAARFEEFGMVLLEALALGVPVLTSRRVGAAECLPEEYGGWLADGPDPAQLAEHTLRLLANSELRSTLAAAGIARASATNDRNYGIVTAREILKNAGSGRR